MPGIERTAQRTKNAITVIDDEDTRRRVGSLLVRQGYDVCCADVESALKLLNARPFHLLMLDTQMPERACLAFCRTVRSISEIAIVLIVDAHDDSIVYDGLDAGADTYVLRGGKSRDTFARLRSVMRRITSNAFVAEDQREVVFDGWRIDPSKRTLRDPVGTLRQLTAAEYELLLALARNAGTTLSRKQLLDATRFGMAGPSERSIDVHIARLRKEIEPIPHHPIYVKTVRLGGYLFAHDVVFE